jgi:hypothetical protein
MGGGCLPSRFRAFRVFRGSKASSKIDAQKSSTFLCGVRTGAAFSDILRALYASTERKQ